MEMVEFKDLKEIKDEKYPFINCYELSEEERFFVEPNFYTQLTYIKEHFLDKYSAIIEEILSTVKRNKKVIFTGNFEDPVVHYDDFIYRELEDVLAAVGLYFDNKGNPDSDWKD